MSLSQIKPAELTLMVLFDCRSLTIIISSYNTELNIEAFPVQSYKREGSQWRSVVYCKVVT